MDIIIFNLFVKNAFLKPGLHADKKSPGPSSMARAFRTHKLIKQPPALA